MKRGSASAFFRGCLEGKRAPAYLLSGEAAGLGDLLAEAWLDRLRGEGISAELLHWTILDMERGSPSAAWRTPSFFARERIFVLPDLAEMKKAMREETVAFLRAPDPAVLLVIPCTDRKATSFLAPLPAVTQFAMREEEAVATLAARAVSAASASGVRLSHDAAVFLVWWVGIEYGRLKEELGKLLAYAGRTGEIGEAEIREVCVARGAVDPFALADALIRKDAASCLAMTRAFAAGAESADYRTLVGAIAWKARSGVERRGTVAPAWAGRILAALSRIDRQMKGGSSLPDAQLLELGLLKLLGGKN